MKKLCFIIRKVLARCKFILLMMFIFVFCTSAFFGDYSLPSPPVAQKNMLTWCVFACEASVYPHHTMCEYATMFAHTQGLPKNLSCCVLNENGDISDPTDNNQVNYLCLSGVHLKTQFTLFLRQSTGRNIMYKGELTSYNNTIALESLSFPCFAVKEGALEHCIVVCGFEITSDIYGHYWKVYYWDPWEDGSYRVICVSSPNVNCEIYLWCDMD